MVSATRSITWRSDHSRSGVPRVPRKYFWATMLVALSDHVDGNSTAELLEGHRAVAEVGDPGVAPVPLDLVVGVDAVDREVATDADARLLGSESHGFLQVGRSSRWGECDLRARTTRACGSRPASHKMWGNYSRVTTPVNVGP